jgi:succinate dehydrogenase cytochrome b556 subunit
MIEGMKSAIIGNLTYRGGASQLAFIGHRLSGLGTLLFLIVHILDTSTVYFFPELYEHAIEIYRSTPMMLGEIVLILGVIFHGANGLRLALLNLNPRLWSGDRPARGFGLTLAVTALLGAPAIFFMARAIYLHNICRCAPEEGPDIALPIWAELAITAVLAVALVFLARSRSFRPSAGDIRRSGETWSWLFMRWSAILLLPLVWIHVLIADILFGVHHIDLDYVALRWATLGWRVYDIALLALAFSHGMNGLRIVLYDYITRPGARRLVNWVIIGVWLLVTLIGAVGIIGGVRAPA